MAQRKLNTTDYLHSSDGVLQANLLKDPSNFAGPLTKIIPAMSGLMLGTYPTDVAITDFTGYYPPKVYVTYVTKIKPVVIDSRINDKKNLLQGKFTTDQPYGPNGHPTGRLSLVLEKFTEDGYVTILWPPMSGGAAMVYGDCTVYPPGRLSHWGVRIHTSQLSSLVLVATELASMSCMFYYAKSPPVGRLDVVKARLALLAPKNGFISAPDAMVDSYAAIDVLRSPVAVKFEFPVQGVAILCIEDTIAVVGGLVINAQGTTRYLVRSASLLRTVYVEGRDSNVTAVIRKGDEWKEASIVAVLNVANPRL